MCAARSAIAWLRSQIQDDISEEDVHTLEALWVDSESAPDTEDLVAILQVFSSTFSRLHSEKQHYLVSEAVKQSKGVVCKELETSQPTPEESSTNSPEVQSLQSLYPDLPEDFLCHILACNLNELEAAADSLLNEVDIPRKVEQWRRAQEVTAQKKAEAEKAERKNLLSRFAFEPAKRLPDAKKQPQASVDAWGADKQGQSSKVRFRDGLPVASKGERFVVLQGKEDWDGGSSGKVYTKGKRGKGVV